jgi:ankyrin repeat protein
MKVKVYVFFLCLIGVMGAQQVSDQVVWQKIQRGKLTQGFIDKHNVGLEQLEGVYNGKTPLNFTIKEKMPHAFNLLLDAGVNVRQQSDGTIPIETAVAHGTVTMVRALLEKGVPLSSQVCRLASQREDMLKFFDELLHEIKLGGRRDRKNKFEFSRSDVDMCLENMLLTVESTKDLQRVLELGARTDYHDESGEMAIDYAVQGCRDQNVKILLSQASPEPRKESIDVVTKKCEEDLSGMPNSCCRTVDVLLTGEDRSMAYQHLLNLIQHHDLSESFLKENFAGLNGLDINRIFKTLKNEDVLSFAVRQCDKEAIKLLLKYGASNIQHAFSLALKSCPQSIIRLLLDHGAKLFRADKPLLQIIQFNPHAKKLISWLAPDVSMRTRQDALTFACLQGNVSVVEILVQHGANIDNSDKRGSKPLWNALLSQKIEMVKALIDYGVKNDLTAEQLNYAQTFFPAGYQLVAGVK